MARVETGLEVQELFDALGGVLVSGQRDATIAAVKHMAAITPTGDDVDGLVLQRPSAEYGTAGNDILLESGEGLLTEAGDELDTEAISAPNADTAGYFLRCIEELGNLPGVTLFGVTGDGHLETSSGLTVVPGYNAVPWIRDYAASVLPYTDVKDVLQLFNPSLRDLLSTSTFERYLGIYDQRVEPNYLLLEVDSTGVLKSNKGVSITGRAVTDVLLHVTALAGHTGNLFLIEDSSGVDRLAVSATGDVIFTAPAGVGAVVSTVDAGWNSTRSYLNTLVGNVVGQLIRAGVAAPTADLLRIESSAQATLLRVNKDGYLGIRKTTAPVAGDIPASEFVLWWDDVNSRVNIRGKSNANLLKDQVIPDDEYIEDVIGAMVESNSETGITVSYDDDTRKLNFVLDYPVSDEVIQDVVGLMVQDNVESANIEVTYDDATGKLNFSVDVPSADDIKDIVGQMVTGNTESGITVSYQVGDRTLDFEVDDTVVQFLSEKGVANGYASLDANGLVPTAQLPPLAPDTEATQDLVGDMVTGSTQTRITVSYDDATGKINFVVDALDAEAVQDVIGAMVDGNTESGITVAYDDINGKLNFTVDPLDTELVQDIIGAMVTGNTESGITVDYDDATGKLNFTVDALDTEAVQDIVGGMVTGNTETGISVTYDDATGKLNFAVDALDQEAVQDIIGAMVSGNTETGITVTYDDTGAKLNFALDDEYIQDLIGAMVSGNTETGITVTYDDTGAKLNFAVTVTDWTTEALQDLVGAMVTGNTETGITVDYQDADGTLDFVLDTEYIQDLVAAMLTGNAGVTYDDAAGTIDLPAGTMEWVDKYGTGADGAVTISANTTLTADKHYTTLVVNTTRILTTDGWKIHATTSVTVSGTGAIRNNGTSPGGASAVAPGAPGNTLSRGGDGATGGTVNGSPGEGFDVGLGGNGGAGSGGLGTGGKLTLRPNALSPDVLAVAFAGGGGGGSGGNASNSGSSGGGGGGIVYIASPTITGDGEIEAKGGAGFAGTRGGGGGGGGVIILIYDSFTHTGGLDVSGGAGGVGSTSSGSAGNTGTIVKVDAGV